MKHLRWIWIFFLLTQCGTTGPVYTSLDFEEDQVSLDALWEGYVRVYEQYFAVAQTTTTPHTLTSKPKIQLKVIDDKGTVMRVRRIAYGKVEKVKRDWIFSLRITMEVDQPGKLGLEEDKLREEALSTWSADFQEMKVRPEHNFNPVWKSIGQDEPFEKRVLKEIENRVRPKIDS